MTYRKDIAEIEREEERLNRPAIDWDAIGRDLQNKKRAKARKIIQDISSRYKTDRPTTEEFNEMTNDFMQRVHDEKYGKYVY